VIAVLAILLLYRRFRRNFGRQRLQPVRMRLRIVILAVLACALVPMAMRSGQFLMSDIAGLLAGSALAVWGARRTRYLSENGQWYYLPHSYTGIAVSLLLVGRLVYRIAQVYGYQYSAMPGLGMGAGAPGAQSFQSGMMARSPLTLGMLCVVIGYYVCYYSLVLWNYKHISPEDLEASSASSAASP
jgi:hypothetical protein